MDIMNKKLVKLPDKVENFILLIFSLSCFTGLIDRILKFYFNLDFKLFTVFYYLLLLLVIFVSLLFLIRKYKILPLMIRELILIVLIYILFSLIYILHPGEPTLANILATKDFVLPVTFIFMGLLISIIKFVKISNYLLLIMLLYANLQEILFLSGKLSQYLPWDFIFLQGNPNFFEGGILRYFGTLDSFFDFQVRIYLFLILLLVYKNKSIILRKEKCVFYSNILFIIFLTALKPEASPLGMFFIILCTYGLFFILKIIKDFKVKKLLVKQILLLLILGIFCSSIVGFMLNHFSGYEVSYQKILNISTGRIMDIQSAQQRWVNWEKGLEAANKTVFGYGPARASMAAQRLISDYIGPHDNFIALYLSYGIIGVGLFIFLLIYLVYLSIYDLILDHKSFLFIGILIAFIVVSKFNLAFIGYNGALFWIIIGMMIKEKFKLSNKSY